MIQDVKSVSQLLGEYGIDYSLLEDEQKESIDV